MVETGECGDVSHSPASFRLRRNSRTPLNLSHPDHHHYRGAKRGGGIYRGSSSILESEGSKQTPDLPPAARLARASSALGRQLFENPVPLGLTCGDVGTRIVPAPP